MLPLPGRAKAPAPIPTKEGWARAFGEKNGSAVSLDDRGGHLVDLGKIGGRLVVILQLVVVLLGLRLQLGRLLEQVHREPPRDLPFSKGYTPHFNWLKYFALWGVHIMDAIQLDPARFAKICPPFASFAGRIYGYIQKAKVTPAQKARWQADIDRIMKGGAARE